MNLPETGDDSEDAVGLRLVALRTVLGYGERQQRAFADYLGLGPPRYNNYETGRQRVPIEVALMITRRTGISLDWLYRGRVDLLPHYIAERLSDLGKPRKAQA